MSGMKKTILSLFVAFTLLVAPIAHAAGMNCEGYNCQVSEQSKKQSKSEKQDDGKMANAEHHCCCPHVSSIPDLAMTEPMKVSSCTIFVLEQDATTSVVVGPPLKPPSHA